MFLPKLSGMWKRHYLIPEYIPAKGRQEVCWKTSCTECEADKNHFSLMSCIQDSCQLEQILLGKCNCSFFFCFFCCLSCQQKRRAGKKQKTEFHRKPFCWKMQPELHHHRHQVTLMVSTVSRKSQSRKLERVHTVICSTKLHFIFKEMQERKSPLSLLIIICIHTVHKSGAKPSAPSP